MVSYSAPDGSNKIPEMVQEDVGTFFVSKIKVISSISRHSSTFSEVFISICDCYLGKSESIVASLASVLNHFIYINFIGVPQHR
jgi:hypothetical protein